MNILDGRKVHKIRYRWVRRKDGIDNATEPANERWDGRGGSEEENKNKNKAENVNKLAQALLGYII